MSKQPAIDRKREVLRALTHHVRVLTIDQAARNWWSHTARPRNNAKKRLAELEKEGMVQCFEIQARSEIELQEPVFTWSPGDPEPDFGPIASQLRRRWRGPFVPTEVVIATRKAMREFGGHIGGRRPRDSEATHDIHLAQVYLQFRREQPELLNQWVPEAQQYAEGGGKNERLPDVIIRDAELPRLVIEFAGAYSKPKLEAFHAATAHIPYQLW